MRRPACRARYMPPAYLGVRRGPSRRVPVSGKQRVGGVAGCADAAGPIRGPAKPAAAAGGRRRPAK